MTPLARLVLALALPLALAPDAVSQHCGGPCEIPRPFGEPICPNPRFTLPAGAYRANWHYLDNYEWAVDGVPEHSLAETFKAPELRFGLRGFFVSPAGNGVLVTGRPYTETHRHGDDRSLFVFVRPTGEIALRVRVADALAEEEQVPGPCPSCSKCRDVLLVFEQDPVLSANDAFVELTAAGTGRTLSFFLPLGAPVADRRAFDDRLAALDWARVPAERRQARLDEIDALVSGLAGSDEREQLRAESRLIAAGSLALPLLRAHIQREPDRAAIDRLRGVADRLRPWADVGYERMARDLDLLVALLDFEEDPVAAAARRRLEELLPGTKPADWSQWISDHRGRLQWDAETRRYELGAKRP